MAKKKKYSKRQILIIPVVLLVLLTIYTLFRAYQAHQDIATRKIANQKGQQLQDYVEKNKIAPSSLAEAGVTNVPNSIIYSKVSDKDYIYCVKFHRNNDPSVSRFRQVVNLVWTRPDALVKQASYSILPTRGTLVVDDLHPAGTECQQIEDYTLTPRVSLTLQSSYAALPNSVCNVHYSGSDSGTNPNYPWYYGGDSSLPNSVIQIKFLHSPIDNNNSSKYVNDPAMQIFDHDCNSISLSDLKLGDPIYEYHLENPLITGSRLVIAIKKL